MKRSISRLFTLVCFLLIAGALAWGGGQGEPKATSTTKTKVVFKTDWFGDKIGDKRPTSFKPDEWGTEAAWKAFDRFQQLHPEYDIQLEYLAYNPWLDDSPRLLTTMIQGGSGPSFYPAFDDDSQRMINMGFYADITDVVKSWEGYQYIPDSLRGAMTKDGKIYSIPPDYMNYFDGFGIRTDLIQQAGLPQPKQDWTIDDFRMYAKALTDPAKKRWGFAFIGDNWARRQYFMWSRIFGLPWFIPDTTGKHTLELNPDLVKVSQFYYDCIWVDKSALSGIDVSWDSLDGAFEAGRIAMNRFLLAQFQGTAIGWDQKEGSLKLNQIGYRLSPTIFDKVGDNLGTNFYGVNPAGTPTDIKARAQFITFWLGGEGKKITNQAAADHGVLPGDAVPSIYKNADVPNPALKKIPSDFTDAAAGMMKIPLAPDALAFGIEYSTILPKIYDLMNAHVQRIVTDQSVDVNKEFASFKNLVDTTVFNEFLPDKANVTKYWNALNDFYKKAFPKYYDGYFKDLYARTSK